MITRMSCLNVHCCDHITRCTLHTTYDQKNEHFKNPFMQSYYHVYIVCNVHMVI